MDKYLISILKEVNTIIIPGIGALTIVNQATGEVMFMSYMKFDDGKLAEHIAQKEGWELNDAKNLVSKYVRDITTKLNQGDTYDIYQFGSFFKNTDGEIDFSKWDGLSTSSSANMASEESNSETPEELKSKHDAIADSDPIQAKLNEIQVEAEASAAALEKEVEEINHEKADHSIDGVIDLIEDVVAPIPEDKKVVANKAKTPIVPISEEKQWKDDLDVSPINLKKETPKKPILEKTEKDKIKKRRGVGFYILIFLLLVLIGGGTYVGINYNELKQHIPFLADNSATNTEKSDDSANDENEEVEGSANQQEVDTDEAKIEEESIKNNEVQETIEEPVKKPEPIVVNSSNGLTLNKALPIQIIAGSFTEEDNAQRKIAQLKASGINAEMIGRYDGLHLVSIASFNTSAEMKASTETLKNTGESYWIFKK